MYNVTNFLYSTELPFESTLKCGSIFPASFMNDNSGNILLLVDDSDSNKIQHYAAVSMQYIAQVIYLVHDTNSRHIIMKLGFV